jgi:hypothetical protein
MTWFDYILLGLWILGALLTVGQIGKPRQPTTPSVGVIIVVLDLLLIAGLLATRGVIA